MNYACKIMSRPYNSGYLYYSHTLYTPPYTRTHTHIIKYMNRIYTYRPDSYRLHTVILLSVCGPYCILKLNSDCIFHGINARVYMCAINIFPFLFCMHISNILQFICMLYHVHYYHVFFLIIIIMMRVVVAA